MDTIAEVEKKRNSNFYNPTQLLPVIANNTKDQWFNASRLSNDNSVGEDDKSKTRYKSLNFDHAQYNKLKKKKSKLLFNNLKKAYFGESNHSRH